MGMNYSAVDETARVFQAGLKRGRYVQCGVDSKGDPVYMLKESLTKPFNGMPRQSSLSLHVVLRASILVFLNLVAYEKGNYRFP
jgi:hypothetical protein